MNTYPQTPNVGPEATRTQIAEQLASFCRGEMSAVETYEKAISHEALAPYVETLRHCKKSHEARVALLSAQITKLGGTIPTSSGVWGTLVGVLSDTASAVSAKASIAVLEEGEDHGLRDYRADIKNLDTENQDFMRQRIMPEQMDTHRIMSALKHSITH